MSQNELEKQLCCVCNGQGIQEGENALCPEHYKSEVIDKKPQSQEQPIQDLSLSINLNWDDENSCFLISYCEKERAIFQVKMTPAAFEKMTSDMIRTVKNYNLFQAQQYQKEKNNESTKSGDGIGTDEMDDAKAEIEGFEGTSIQSEEIEQKGTCGST